ncbi:MAG: hypothetical protein IT562_23925 [Alphaproteobacteria bacterium]|nr:hypothetical protein [Alphaproteobacteria bacterium]
MLRFMVLAGCLSAASACAQGTEPTRASAGAQGDQALARKEAIREIQRRGCARVLHLALDSEGSWIGEALCGSQVVDVAVSEGGEVIAWPAAPALARHPDGPVRQPPLN